jgi:hypothetical protein
MIHDGYLSNANDGANYMAIDPDKAQRLIKPDYGFDKM